MLGGFMFVRIRGMPYSDGGNWIAAGYQNQFGQETQVIAMICKAKITHNQRPKLMVSRRCSPRCSIPDADPRHPVPDLAETAATSGLALERGHFHHVFRVALTVPS